MKKRLYSLLISLAAVIGTLALLMALFPPVMVFGNNDVSISLTTQNISFQTEPPPVYHGEPGELTDNETSIEIMDMRTQTSKTYFLGNNRYSLFASISSLHYKDNLDNDLEQWKNIETSIQPSQNLNWDWEVTKGLWHLRIKNDTTVAIGKSGGWLGFKYEGFAYLDVDKNEYVILDSRRNVTPTILGNKIRWDNLFYGCNLEYIYTPGRFKENLEITQQARDWCAANPPSSYGLNNATTFLCGWLSVDWSNSYPAEDTYGYSLDWNNSYDFFDRTIFFREPIKDKIVTALPIGYATSTGLSPDQWVKLRYKFYKHTDGNNYLLYGAKVIDLNQYPSGTITIDPTVDEEISANGDDGFNAVGHSFRAGDNQIYMGDSSGGGGYGDDCDAFFRWLGISLEGNIDTSYISLYVYYSEGTPNVRIYGVDEDDPDAPTSAAEYVADPETTNYTNWDFSYSGEGYHNSPSINTLTQELVDSYTISNAAFMVQVQDNGGAANDQFVCIAYEHDANLPAIFYAEYTAGGNPAITNTQATWSMGVIDVDDVVYFSADGSQDDDYSQVENTGDVACDVEIQGTDAEGGSYDWLLAASPSTEQYSLYANSSNGSSTYDVEVKSSAYNDLITALAVGAVYNFSMKFTAATAGNANDDGSQKSATVTLVASEST